jgi:hypothetical protein
MAASSIIAAGAAVEAIDMYLHDFGNTTTMGHRRWVLSHGLDTVGIGSTDNYSCMSVVHSVGGSDPAFVAWPPPGDFPAQASYWLGNEWTIQSNAINLTGAIVTASADGEPIETETWDLFPGSGSETAIGFKPTGFTVGWNVRPGRTYHIEASTSPPISFDVHIVDCDE